VAERRLPLLGHECPTSDLLSVPSMRHRHSRPLGTLRQPSMMLGSQRACRPRRFFLSPLFRDWVLMSFFRCPAPEVRGASPQQWPRQ
jgi:hypothetical protein